MRYRFFFDIQHLPNQLPIEIYCGRWEFHPKAKRRLIVWATARSRKSIDVWLPSRVVMVKDDHGRLVWPDVAAVIAKAKRPPLSAVTSEKT